MEDYVKRSDALNFDLEIECEPEDLQPMMEGMVSVMDYIKKLPAADVVEVVRCADCAYCDSASDGWCQCENSGAGMPLDGFCSDGERKDGDGDG